MFGALYKKNGPKPSKTALAWLALPLHSKGV
jgi:hypothetical protein